MEKKPSIMSNDTPTLDNTPASIAEKETNSGFKKHDAVDIAPNISEKYSDKDSIDSNVQHGIQRAQAVNKVWTRNHLIMAYVLYGWHPFSFNSTSCVGFSYANNYLRSIWLVEFTLAYSSGITGALTPYVTSSFQKHSLTALTSVISSLIAGLVKLPYAKLIDNWGRPQGLALMVASMTLGTIMMAGCNNVQTYCAAQVFYYVGYNGIDFSITIFIADTSALKNRALMIAFSSSPWLATVWASGPTAQSILQTIGFRWGFGIWAIIIPVACSPLFFLFYYNQRKAEKQGLLTMGPSGRTFSENVIYYCREFDVIGLLLISTGLALFLLSFNLYAYQKNEWRSPLIICFVIFGGLLIIAFALYEHFLAPVTFIPWELMKNRTVFFTYAMVACLYTSWSIWDSYFYSMLIVVFDTGVPDATYIGNIYTIGSCIWSIVMGIIIRYNGRLKWQALYFGVPITILGVGLMIKFRQPGVNIGYVAMCQIFIAFGGGTLVICEQMTVTAVSSQAMIPALLSMESMIASVGEAIGSTIAEALWSGVFPEKLAKYLPASAQGNLKEIYGSITVQSSYPVGSPTRTAIDHAYGDTQRLMLITATCLHILTWISVLLWKDVDVRKIKQVKGLVF
jgi:MFS family permease